MAILPTGAGKSLIVGELAGQCVAVGKRVMVLTHRKELLKQDREKLTAMHPGVKSGYYSAGLGEKNATADVVFAGVQSACRNPYDFGKIDLVLIDEAHLVSKKDDGQYAKTLQALRVSNPRLRKVGLTATGYRLDSGIIYGPGQPFSEICHETSIREMLD